MIMVSVVVHHKARSVESAYFASGAFAVDNGPQERRKGCSQKTVLQQVVVHWV